MLEPGPGILLAIGTAALLAAAAWGVAAALGAAARGRLPINAALGLRVAPITLSAENWRQGHRIAERWARPAAWVVTGSSVGSVAGSASAVVYIALMGVGTVALMIGVLGGTIDAILTLKKKPGTSGS